MAMTPLEDEQFTQFLRAKALEAEKKLKYRPTLFLQMLGDMGGYRAAAQLLGSGGISEGFKKLWEKRRLDLTVEALVLESEWGAHFDPALLRIAEKRLREVGYAPQVPAPPPAAPAPAITVVVRWPETLEYIPLDLASMAAGDGLDTLETFHDHSDPGTYDVLCTEFERDAQGWTVALLYDRGRGANPELARAYPKLQWGTTQLRIAADLSAISARFEATTGDSTDGECSLLQPQLFAPLSRGQANVLLRPGQGALRRKLLERYGRCAVSNECARDALEAAHLIDHGEGGSASCENAILLRADLHSLFDAGKLRIDDSGAIELAGLPAESPYHGDWRERWNQRLRPEVLLTVRAALARRRERTG